MADAPACVGECRPPQALESDRRRGPRRQGGVGGLRAASGRGPGQAARRSLDAARGRAEAAILVRLAGALLTEHDPLTEVMEQVHTTFNLQGVGLLHKEPTGGWQIVSAAGDYPGVRPWSTRARSQLGWRQLMAGELRIGT